MTTFVTINVHIYIYAEKSPLNLNSPFLAAILIDNSRLGTTSALKLGLQVIYRVRDFHPSGAKVCGAATGQKRLHLKN